MDMVTAGVCSGMTFRRTSAGPVKAPCNIPTSLLSTVTGAPSRPVARRPDSRWFRVLARPQVTPHECPVAAELAGDLPQHRIGTDAVDEEALPVRGGVTLAGSDRMTA